MRWTAALIILLSLLSPSFIVAAPVEWNGGKTEIPLGGKVDVFLGDEDPSLDDVLRAPEARWRASGSETPTPGFAGFAWMRLDLVNTTNEHQLLYLESATPWIDRLTIHVTREGELVHSRTLGDVLPFEARPVAHRSLVYPIELPPDVLTTVYLHYKSRGSIAVLISLHGPKGFVDTVPLEYTSMGLYFGFMGAFTLYNLILFLMARQRGYLFYSLYLIAASVLYLLSTGFATHLLSIESGYWNNEVMLSSGALAGLCIVLFARKFLMTSETMPWIDRILKGLAIVHSGLVAYSLYSYETGVIVNYIVGVTTLSLMLVIGLLALRLRLNQSLFFFMAWFFAVMGFALELLASSGIVHSAFFARYGSQSGTLVQAFVFSLALGFRARVNRLEREKSEVKLRAVERELETARKIQRRILPERPPLKYEAAIQITYEPLYAVGGDFYDFAEAGPNALGVIIADVSGHGVAAALDSSTVKIAFQTAGGFANEPAALMTMMNSLIHQYVDYRFLSSAYVLIQNETNELIYCTAGHPPLLVVRPGSGELFHLETDDPLLGLDPAMKYESRSFAFETGDRLFLYTDGIFETFDERYARGGLEVLEEAVCLSASVPPDKSSAMILDHIQKTRPHGDHQDDITLLQIVL